MPTIPETIAIKRAAEGGLMTKNARMGVGLGGKLVGPHRTPTGELAITVLVDTKVPNEELPRDQQVPPVINGKAAFEYVGNQTERPTRAQIGLIDLAGRKFPSD